jgi:hypothetical protein
MARAFNLCTLDTFYDIYIFGGIFLLTAGYALLNSTPEMHTGEYAIYIPDVIVVDEHNLVGLTKYLMSGISHCAISSKV